MTNDDKERDVKELEILRVVKRILTDVARDTHVQPGVKHPLSNNTIMGIRDGLGLIAAREKEIGEGLGITAKMKPHFIDEPKKNVVVSIDAIKSSKPKPKDS